MKLFKDVVKYFIILCMVMIALYAFVCVLQVAPWSVKIATIIFLAVILIVVLNYIIPDEKDGEEK